MLEQVIQKAAILHEALPYIRRFHGAVFVVKYGGHAMVDPELRNSFARNIALMKYVGLNPIVVHGGGPQIDKMLESLGVKSERVDGLRVTDDQTMDVVEMVLGGAINQEIVTLVCNHGGRAVGLTGKDDRFLIAERIERMETKSGKAVDPGRVGRIAEVRADLLKRLVQDAFIPVVAPVAVDRDGRALNVNADTVAGAIAKAVGAAKLVLMTDTSGVCDDKGQLLSSLTSGDIQSLIDRGVIHGGMIPKVECALDALAGGVEKCHIIDGRRQHAVLLEIFTDGGTGTEIVQARGAK